MSRRGLEFLGTLAGGLVHEIKNPLSTLRINLTLLKEDVESALPGERRMRHRIEILEQEVGRLDAILQDFMRYAGMRRLERTRQDLGTLAGELAEFVGPGFELDNVRLSIDVPTIEAEVDGPLLKQALLNILLNAQQATRGGGKVTLRGRRSDRIELEVSDDGCGVTEEDRGKIFDVYYSGFGSGSGLGLPTARRILEEHGGGLDLESEEGEGTRVVLWLPAP